MTLPRELMRAVRRLDDFQLRRLAILVRGLLLDAGGPVVELQSVPGFPGVSYRRVHVPCGKACASCPHGPYWYASWKEGGRTRSQYIGRDLPREVRQLLAGAQPGVPARAPAAEPLKLRPKPADY